MRKLKNHELNRLTVEEFKNTGKNPVCILLENVRSLNNVGSAFRTADAFLVEQLYLCGITGKPPHREINKTALGATESVEWSHHKNSIELVDLLKDQKRKIVSVEQTDEGIPLNAFQPGSGIHYCFVFGNEVHGVSEELVNASDLCLEIPQMGTKHSLNISVAVGIVLWDFLNKLSGDSINLNFNQ